ncbi:serine carboxypeptidase-like 18 [Pistacia vera]|uniref:serine carboxypeptidase-like 18 n=1 Tax=Pistacia vera TaxID=55513 RepID=UPI001262BA80|nr:serine carboxypeptidase-like 18 [Pistacia vera]
MNNMHLRFISPLRLRWIYFILILLLKLSASTVFSGSIVKYLPGYEGQLPFKLETGYESVGDSELFYYFIESQGDIEEDPLILWLSGGPGCSSFYGLIYEIGPLEFDIQNYTGGLPRLKYYPYAWTKTASIIFLDAPVGTGFSYARNREVWPTSDSKSAEQSYQFLKKWLLKHPQYLQVELYIGGDSYSGMVVPQITQKIIDENGLDAHLRMNLKGYIMGSPHTDSIVDENSKIIFAHRMALISDELFQELKTSCKGNYHNADVSNTRCVAALQTYKNLDTIKFSRKTLGSE